MKHIQVIIWKNKVVKSADDISKLSIKIESKSGTVNSSFKLKFIFNIMRMMQKSNDWNMVYKNHWKENGWLDKNRPW